MTQLPGRDACWGPNLWLIHLAGRLELAGDGHRRPVALGASDLEPLLAASRSAGPLDRLPAHLADALADRGWDPVASAATPAGPVRPSCTDPSALVASSGHPVLVRIVRGVAQVWDPRRHSVAEVPAAALASLTGSATSPAPVDDADPPAPPVTSSDLPWGSAAGEVGERVPIWFATCAERGDGNPLALGMVSAAIRAHEGGRLLATYAPRPIQVAAAATLADIAACGRPGILMLSNYAWTVEHNLALAEEAKVLAPGTLTVFGGPSAPKYEADAEAFLADHPQVDLIVRGEGEVTCADLLDALDGDLTDLKPLLDVAGLTFRLEGRTVRTTDPERLTDLDSIPSAYLTGLFDHLTDHQGVWALETNRGCPYGCTFCDWGAATLSRVRLLDLDRVRAEIDWLATNGIQSVFIADANFGMYARDVEITQHLVDQKARYGAPNFIIATFAKNTTKHTIPIVELLVGAGLASEATLSLQTTDSTVLTNIRRKNVKQRVYDELADDARERRIPLLSDLMFALPGSDLETFKTDLQVCLEGDVTTRAFGTIVLPNSPMNDPAYRHEHGIEVDSAGQLVATNTFGRDEREEMVRFRDAHRIVDHFGVLREVIRYVAHERGLRAVDVLWDLYARAAGDPARFPLVGWLLLSGRRYLTEPLGWDAFFAEVRDLVVDEFRVVDDDALGTVLAVQQALLPSPGRTFPDRLALPHDYVGYWRRARSQDGDEQDPPALRSFGPGELTVTDPSDLSSRAFRESVDLFFTPEGTRKLFQEGGFMGDEDWELDSPIKRAMRGSYA